MTTPAWTIVSVLIAAFLAAIGQLFLKLGAASVSANPWSWLLNWELIVGLFWHGLSFVLLVIGLKHGSLSILYPFLATSYIWVVLLSIRFLNEPFSWIQSVGLVLIVGGIGIIVK